MPIYINGRFLMQRQTGVQRYALETLLALDALVSESKALERADIVVLAPRGTTPPPLRAIRFETVGPLTGHAWEQLTLPTVCGSSLLLSFAATGPLIKSRQVITMHDAAVFAVPETYSAAFRNWYRALLPLLARRAEYVVTVSEFSKRELIQHLGPAASRALVSGEGWQHVTRHDADPRILDRHGLGPRKYFLVVGSITPHKNLAVVARAARALGDRLGFTVAVAGPADPNVFSAAERDGCPVVKLLGYVSEGELRSLYENATAFIHPSKYEGFGIPPIEAMGLGCPVIASRAAAIPEVCGEAAWYFEPDDAVTLANMLRSLMEQPNQRDALISKGHLNVQRHSWRATAECYVSIIERALGERRMAPDRIRLAPMDNSPEAQAWESTGQNS